MHALTRSSISKIRLTTLFCIGVVTTACVSPPPLPPDTVSAVGRAQANANGSLSEKRGASAILLASHTPSSYKPDFSGFWSIDPEASDNLQEKIREAMREMNQAGGGGRSKQSGSKGQKRGGGKGGGKRQGRGSSGTMAGGTRIPYGEISALVNASQTLEITHDDPSLLIIDENDRPQRLFTDFRGASVSASGGPQQQVTIAAWEGTVLVTETTLNNGSRLIQRFRIEAETGQLMISSVARFSESQSVLFQLVYNRLKLEVPRGEQ